MTNTQFRNIGLQLGLLKSANKATAALELIKDLTMAAGKPMGLGALGGAAVGGGIGELAGDKEHRLRNILTGALGGTGIGALLAKGKINAVFNPSLMDKAAPVGLLPAFNAQLGMGPKLLKAARGFNPNSFFTRFSQQAFNLAPLGAASGLIANTGLNALSENKQDNLTAAGEGATAGGLGGIGLAAILALLSKGKIKVAGHPGMPPGGIRPGASAAILAALSALLGTAGAGVGAVTGGAKNLYDQASEKGLSNTDVLELLKSTGMGGLIGGAAGAATIPTIAATEKYGPAASKALRKALRLG